VNDAPTPPPANGTQRPYRVSHRTWYRCDEEVTGSYGRAHLIPRHGDGQRRETATVLVQPAPAEQRDHTDFFGNRSTYFEVQTPHTELSVTALSEVTVNRPIPDREVLAELGWERLRDQVAAEPVGPELLEARAFLLPSPLVAPSPELRAYTGAVFKPGRSIGEVLSELVERIHDEFAYVTGATTVGTPLTEVLARREGVCQDFAHLAVGLLRCAGLPARYVSGYIETQPPPGRSRLQGADASHAWASAFLPALGWVDLDPTNRKLIDDSYVTVAVGRDYEDVPPLRGVIFTESTNATMEVSVDVVPIDPIGPAT